LIGTIIGAGQRIAVLFNQSTRNVSQVREGKEESGWLIKAVSPRSAVAEKGGVEATLDLPRPDDPLKPDAATAAVEQSPL
jgi:hypothetical protein